jgi:hypothetical protein
VIAEKGVGNSPPPLPPIKTKTKTKTIRKSVPTSSTCKKKEAPSS